MEIQKARQVQFKAINEVEKFPVKRAVMWQTDSNPW